MCHVQIWALIKHTHTHINTQKHTNMFRLCNGRAFLGPTFYTPTYYTNIGRLSKNSYRQTAKIILYSIYVYMYVYKSNSP